jgi:hypothetical protein
VSLLARLSRIQASVEPLDPYSRPGGPERFNREVPEVWVYYARLMEIAAATVGIDIHIDEGTYAENEEQERIILQACSDLPYAHPEAKPLFDRIVDLINEWEQKKGAE